MDLQEAMRIWGEQDDDHIMVSHQKDDAFILYFVYDNEVEGHFTTVPGSMNWDYPQRLMDIKKKENEQISNN